MSMIMMIANLGWEDGKPLHAVSNNEWYYAWQCNYTCSAVVTRRFVDISPEDYPPGVESFD